MHLRNDVLDKGTLEHVKKIIFLLKFQLKWHYSFGSRFTSPNWTQAFFVN